MHHSIDEIAFFCLVKFVLIAEIKNSMILKSQIQYLLSLSLSLVNRIDIAKYN